jgi:hypothetical protein
MKTFDYTGSGVVVSRAREPGMERTGTSLRRRIALEREKLGLPPWKFAPAEVDRGRGPYASGPGLESWQRAQAKRREILAREPRFAAAKMVYAGDIRDGIDLEDLKQTMGRLWRRAKEVEVLERDADGFIRRFLVSVESAAQLRYRESVQRWVDHAGRWSRRRRSTVRNC